MTLGLWDTEKEDSLVRHYEHHTEFVLGTYRPLARAQHEDSHDNKHKMTTANTVSKVITKPRHTQVWISICSMRTRSRAVVGTSRCASALSCACACVCVFVCVHVCMTAVCYVLLFRWRKLGACPQVCVWDVSSKDPFPMLKS